MIVVNNPGTWSHIYPPLKHAQWNGLTPTDLIFPFFMFIMGVSMYISLSKSNFTPSPGLYKKIIRRSLLLILIGWLIGTLGFFLRQWYLLADDPSISIWQRIGKSLWSLPTLRVLGVFPRLGITYGIAACLTVWLSQKQLRYTIAGVLILYALILIFGNGYEYGEGNILSVVDRAILTRAHMYYDNGIDPEGILSTIPATIHVLIGVLTGHTVMTMKGNERLVTLFSQGAIMALVGYIISWWLPINKKIWSPTFVLVTCGLGILFLALLIYIIDHKEKGRWIDFFVPFGSNPLFTYLVSTMLALLFLRVRIPIGDGYTTVASWGYQSLLTITNIEKLASLLYAFIFMLINWNVGYILHKKKIYIKI